MVVGCATVDSDIDEQQVHRPQSGALPTWDITTCSPSGTGKPRHHMMADTATSRHRIESFGTAEVGVDQVLAQGERNKRRLGRGRLRW